MLKQLIRLSVATDCCLVHCLVVCGKAPLIGVSGHDDEGFTVELQVAPAKGFGSFNLLLALVFLPVGFLRNQSIKTR